MTNRVYIIQVEMSSPYRIAESEQIDDDTLKIKYFYPKDVRQKIERIRGRYKRQIYANTVHFYGLLLVNDELLDKVRKIVDQANAELKEVDGSLSARMITIPISREAMQGELYEKVYYAIMYQIAKSIHDRLKDIKSNVLKPESRASIKQMLKKLRELNIINDQRIDEMIASIESKLNMTVQELRNEILEQLEYIEKLLSS